jgi:hypothetical protein
MHRYSPLFSTHPPVDSTESFTQRAASRVKLALDTALLAVSVLPPGS